MKKLVYLHGFNSSPASKKASLASHYFASRDDVQLIIPELPPEPKTAIKLVDAIIQDRGCDGLIGSSLGGYYSLYFHQRYRLSAALINPAIRPYDLLEEYIGINTNMYTGEQYEVTAEHMNQLVELDVSSQQLDLSRLFLLVESGDEVLDYREACVKLHGAKLYLQRGGDHSYTHFAEHLSAIHQFFERNSIKN